MSVHIAIVDGPVPATAALAPTEVGRVGAVLSFDGIVREMEDGRRLIALDYEAYEPMATRELTAVAEEVVRAHGLIALACWHSRGRVPVGAASLRVVIRAAHRGEALVAMGAFIDRLKRDVPIWKKPVWA
jgi:molybdopterin synthase catalytic subunit